MLSVATSLFNYASQLVNQVNTAKIQLTQAANSIAFQLRNANNQEILTFLTSLRNELSSNVEQLISTYSPSNVMNFILSAYQSFLGQLSRQTAELRSLTSLYNTKILNSRARDCWTNFRQASNAIYSAAGANFTGFVENETRAVQGQLDSVRNQIQQEVQTISILFRSALQNPSNAVQLLTQYVSTWNENFMHESAQMLESIFSLKTDSIKWRSNQESNRLVEHTVSNFDETDNGKYSYAGEFDTEVIWNSDVWGDWTSKPVFGCSLIAKFLRKFHCVQMRTAFKITSKLVHSILICR